MLRLLHTSVVHNIDGSFSINFLDGSSILTTELEYLQLDAGGVVRLV